MKRLQTYMDYVELTQECPLVAKYACLSVRNFAFTSNFLFVKDSHI